MAYNPFLSTHEPNAPVTTEVLNPFMMTDSEPNNLSTDNPFAASNPFSDIGGSYEPPVGDTVPVDIFGPEPTGIGAKHFPEFQENGPTILDIFTNEPMDFERANKPTELDLVTAAPEQTALNHEESVDIQPSARPLPPETQNLILSVTGQMEFTSSHLLDRIPPTRTPSPVSVRDIHSPSPTPDPDSELLDDLPQDSFDINRNKPVRPPPARPPHSARAPPPRPQPPRPPPAVASPLKHDDINLFDAPARALCKSTKEDILSLYSVPKKEEKQIDFLSDDILDEAPVEPNGGLPGPFDAEKPATTVSVGLNMDESAAPSKPTLLTTIVSEASDTAMPMDCSEPQAETASVNSNTSPFTEVPDDDFNELRSEDQEKNPFENVDPADATSEFLAEDVNIFGVKSEPIPGMESFESKHNEIFSSTPKQECDASGDTIPMMPMDVFHSDRTSPFSNDASPFATAASPFTAEGDVCAASASPFAIEDSSFADANAITVVGASYSSEAVHGTESDAIMQDAFPESQDAFDAFSAKFDATSANNLNSGVWGECGAEPAPAQAGFEGEAFDSFLSMGAPRLDHQLSGDSADDTFSVFIRPKEREEGGAQTAVPALAPPPRVPAPPDTPRPNPFDESDPPPAVDTARGSRGSRSSRGSGGESPPTPLFDEDMSMPLEEFPRTNYTGPGWEMHLRQPNKKKITGQRFWKKVFVRLSYQGDTPVAQLYNTAGDKEPLQELPLQACYSVSEVAAQQFDQFGKIFTVKLQYVFYKERPGVRPGQVTKAERITNKLSQFAAYAIQGDYQGVKEFGSDLRKLGLPVEHAPQVSQLFKLGSLSYEDVKQFSCCVEEALFRLAAHRDRALTYKMEEVQVTAVDELHVEQDAEGGVLKQIARVRLFFLGFLSGMPHVELGVNDLRRQGREVVGRHDIIPVATEEWIRVEDAQFHACVQPEEFAKSQIIRFQPPDACYVELMRFRVRPPKNRELPLQLKAVWCVTGNKVELRADVLVPGFASRALGQVPCEDVAIRFPIPECWIYLFRVEKHFRYGSVKSAHRRTGKIKGIERFLGAVDALQESLIEVTSGQAKYEHQHRAIVWRMPRLPKEGQGAYTTHNLVCRMALTSYDQVPAELARHAFVEFTMPATQVSHMTVRSVSLQSHDGDPPEKYVRYLARHEYTVGIERTSGSTAPAYALAAQRTDAVPAAPAAPAAPAVPQPPSSESDSD